MIKHAWSVLCERAVTDKETNNVTLSVMEQATFQYSAMGAKPGERILVPISGRFVSLWYRDEKDRVDSVKARIRITDNKGNTFGQAEGTVNFKGRPRARITTIFNTIPVSQKEHQRIVFVVEYFNKRKWKKVAEVPFDIDATRIEGERPQSDLP